MILGVDFLHEMGLVLDFTQTSVVVRRANPIPIQMPQSLNSSTTQILPMYQAEQKNQTRACAIVALEQPSANVIDECAVPSYNDLPQLKLHECPLTAFHTVVEEYENLFHTTPGVTEAAYHFIPTTGNPVRIPPRRFPTHYREEVERQIHTMLEQGIIKESSSPWMVPAVFVKKKSGEIRICVDYRELNKMTEKDAYPLPLPDEVQDRLSGVTVFSKLDLQSGYWQLPVSPTDQEKTVFCPGPGMALYEFQRMPFGLSGAPSSFQRLLDKNFQGLPFVTTYMDDILVHSADNENHILHLDEVFKRLTDAGLYNTEGQKMCHWAGNSVVFGTCVLRLGHDP